MWIPNVNRRAFIKTAGGFLTLFLFLPSWVLAKRKKKKPKLIPESKSMAQFLKYRQNADAIKGSLRKDKSQYCWNCLYYRQMRKVDNQDAGTCQWLRGGYVTAQGWCTSWALKPNAKKPS